MTGTPRADVSPSEVDILMYHSISYEPGPTSITPDIFRGQMETLEACDYQVISLSDFTAWHQGKTDLPPRPVAITFDDGFADFAEHAFPCLKSHGWSATVFLPSGKIGGAEDWRGANEKPRPLLTWEQVKKLSDEGIAFGGHSVTHADLTSLSQGDLRREIRSCKDDIAQHTGKTPASFAPPYGHANAHVREEIAKAYDISVGTRLQRAGAGSDLFEVPRIEMYYFRDLERWRSYLEGSANWYLSARRALRGVKQLATQGMRGLNT